MSGTMRENFAAHYPASLYDRYAERFLAIYDDWVVRRLKQVLAPVPPGAILLDVGTGTARLLCRIARDDAFSPIRFVGIDYFGEMVALAACNVERAGLAARVAIARGDVHNLPFESGTVRCVLSRSTIHHWRDPVLALREIHRVLEPNGVALIHEISRSANQAAVARFNELRRTANVEASRMDEKYTPEEVWQCVTAAGLQAESHLAVPTMGLMSLGMELTIEKRTVLEPACGSIARGPDVR